jgi:hypothetical protein
LAALDTAQRLRCLDEKLLDLEPAEVLAVWPATLKVALATVLSSSGLLKVKSGASKASMAARSFFS